MTKTMRILLASFSAGAAVMVTVGAFAQGTAVANRAQLTSDLGSSAKHETFSEFQQSDYYIPTINSSNGLTATDLSFSSANSSFQTDEVGYYGALSNEILTNEGTLTLNFLDHTTEFGLDIRDFYQYSTVADIIIYATDNSTIIENLTNYAISDSGLTSFIGYQNNSGIGSVSFTAVTGQDRWSPLVSNVSYGSPAVPEPATWAMMLVGMGAIGFAARRRQNVSVSYA